MVTFWQTVGLGIIEKNQELKCNKLFIDLNKLYNFHWKYSVFNGPFWIINIPNLYVLVKCPKSHFLKFCSAFFKSVTVFAHSAKVAALFYFFFSCFVITNAVFCLSAKQFIIGHIAASCSSQFGLRPINLAIYSIFWSFLVFFVLEVLILTPLLINYLNCLNSVLIF